jgi:hypothetical protein
MEVMYVCVECSKEKFADESDLYHKIISNNKIFTHISDWILTAFVLAYNLSRNPWSHVLTLYFIIVSTIAINPSLPPALSLISKSFCNILSSFFGG